VEVPSTSWFTEKVERKQYVTLDCVFARVFGRVFFVRACVFCACGFCACVLCGCALSCRAVWSCCVMLCNTA
jgi:hypothetical protein